MRSVKLISLRIFVFFLLTLFISEGVYATSMMVATQLKSAHCLNQHEGDHHNNYDDHNIKHSHHVNLEDHISHHGKGSSVGDCLKCGHCIACFTLLPPAKIENLSSEHAGVEKLVFKVSYISHISAQPKKPPIKA